MAIGNVDAPTGLIPVNDGAAGAETPVQEYTFPANAAKFSIGSPMVKAAGNSCTPGITGDLVGAVISISWYDADGTLHREDKWPGPTTGATNRVVTIADYENQRFEVQCDGDFTASTDLGKNANLVGSVDSDGYSNVELDSSSIATTASLAVKILRQAKGPAAGSEDGENARVVVKLNTHVNNKAAGV